MQMRWLGVLSAIVLVIACFFPWVSIESKNIVVSGVDATGTSFGKPGYMHLLLSALAIILLLIPKTLPIRMAIFLTAFNAAWAIRNYIVISLCHGGECPVKHTALYIVVVSSFALLIFNLFTGTKENLDKNKSPEL
jgi:hypothetical protein